MTLSKDLRPKIIELYNSKSPIEKIIEETGTNKTIVKALINTVELSKFQKELKKSGIEQSILKTRDEELLHDFFGKKSRIRDYILGVSLSCYSPLTNSSLGLVFRSKHLKVIQMIAHHLNADSKKILSDYRIRENGEINSHSIAISSEWMRDTLEDLDVVNDKRKRGFPDVGKSSLPDVIRGFWDGRGTFYSNRRTNIRITSGTLILNQLADILSEELNISQRPALLKNTDQNRSGSCLTLGHEESLLLAGYMYKGIKYLADENLYLQSKFERFNFDYKPYGLDKRREINMEKIGKAKILLLEGKGIMESSLEAGFKDITSFYKTFRATENMTPKEYVREHNSKKE